MSNKNFGPSKKWKSMVVGVATAVAAIFILSGCGNGSNAGGGNGSSSGSSSTSPQTASRSSTSSSYSVSFKESDLKLTSSNGFSAQEILDKLKSNGFSFTEGKNSPGTYFTEYVKVSNGNNPGEQIAIDVESSDGKTYYVIAIATQSEWVNENGDNPNGIANIWYIHTQRVADGSISASELTNISQLPKP